MTFFWIYQKSREVEFPGEGRVEAAQQEVLKAFVGLFFLVQKRFGLLIPRAVAQMRLQLRHLTDQNQNLNSCFCPTKEHLVGTLVQVTHGGERYQRFERVWSSL